MMDRKQLESRTRRVMDTYTFMVCWIVGSFIGGCITWMVAKWRGHGNPIGWFIFGFFAFVFAVLVALIVTPRINRNNPQRKCPYCGASVPGAVRACPACKRGVPDFGTATVGSWEKTVSGGDDVEKWAKKNQQP
jgi:hypothetical protein